MSTSAKYFGYKIATIEQRMWAGLINNILILAIVFIFSKILKLDYKLWEDILKIIVAIILASIVYKFYPGNLGHKLTGLKIISSENGEDFKNSWSGMGREFFKTLFFYIVILVILFSNNQKNQMIHDKLFNTLVVERN